MPRRSREELTEARNKFIANRENVIARYNEGESAASLARSYASIRDGWVAKQVDAWDVPRRDRSAAAVARGPGVPPMLR
ncbi:hypothetical protein GCM10010211_23470 [Streptomyces albospinus]|uniref:Uncharacterized protein n=1 Tax=Streptomyces albospinus TaxID=285515 RepID=A0ABQ2UXB7_9ACTN|nr:hypothetical protein [Streptomyces albospinus]GGU57895.1 hypothetical protein GCM10010211_23470 [Streptomyces albospinus]